MMKKTFINIFGQTFIEYLMLIGVITGLLVAMSPLVRRFTQGMVKITADQVGNHYFSDQRQDGGYLQRSSVDADEIREMTREDWHGNTTYQPYVLTDQTVEQDSNLGLSKRQ